MKTYTQFLDEAKGNSYKVSVVIDGKVQKSLTMKYEAAMKIFQKAKDSGKAGAGDIDLDKMFKEVDAGKAKGPSKPKLFGYEEEEFMKKQY